MSGRIPRNFNRKKNKGRGWIRKALLITIIITFVSSFLLGVIWVLFKNGIEQSVFFRIEKVDIEGCGYVNPKNVLALTGLDVKTSIWEIRAEELSARLESRNWIEKARIDKDWPNRIRIIITERSPRAIISIEGKLYYVGRKGVVFAPVLPGNDLDFPIITVDDTITGEKSSMERYTSLALDFLRKAASGNPDLPGQNISEIHFSDEGLTIFLVDYPFPIYLGESDMGRKYGRLSKVLSWLYNRRKIAETEYIDMNYETLDEADRRLRNKDVMVVFKES